jgi:hypothetical protein
MAKTSTAAKTETPAPTLEEKIAEIDRRLRQQAIDEKRKIAASHLAEARQRVKMLLAKTTDHELRAALEDVRKLERMAGSDGLGEPTSRGGRRVRRSAEELQADAVKLVDYLRANPGSKASAVFEATGVTVRPPLNIRTFVAKHGPKGAKVKNQGERAGMTYSVA